MLKCIIIINVKVSVFQIQIYIFTIIDSIFFSQCLLSKVKKHSALFLCIFSQMKEEIRLFVFTLCCMQTVYLTWNKFCTIFTFFLFVVILLFKNYIGYIWDYMYTNYV